MAIVRPTSSRASRMAQASNDSRKSSLPPTMLQQPASGGNLRSVRRTRRVWSTRSTPTPTLGAGTNAALAAEIIVVAAGPIWLQQQAEQKPNGGGRPRDHARQRSCRGERGGESHRQGHDWIAPAEGRKN